MADQMEKEKKKNNISIVCNILTLIEECDVLNLLAFTT